MVEEMRPLISNLRSPHVYQIEKTMHVLYTLSKLSSHDGLLAALYTTFLEDSLDTDWAFLIFLEIRIAVLKPKYNVGAYV